MKDFFKKWRDYTRADVSDKATNKKKLLEAYTAIDIAAEKEGEKLRRQKAAAEKRSTQLTSPEGIKKAKLDAMQKKLQPLAKSLQKNEWDSDYLYRLPYMIAYKFSENPATPSPSDPGFGGVVDSVAAKADAVMRATYGKWDTEGRQKFIDDTEGQWWKSSGYQEYVVKPTEEILANA